MNKEDELARQLERELEVASPQQATPPYNLPPEVRQRLETAGQVSQVDFSQGSPLRQPLRASLSVKARRTLPGAFRRAQLTRRLQPVIAVAGLAALALLLVFGISLVINRVRPVPAVSPYETATATATATFTPLPSPTLPDTPAPTATAPALAGSDEKHLTLESGLQVEEFALAGTPDAESAAITLRDGTKAVIGTAPEVFFLPSPPLAAPASDFNASGQRVMTASPLGGETLSAVLFEASRTTNADGSIFLKEAVQVVRGGKVIYTTQPADASPIDPLRGLWSYGGHWVLEYALVANTQTGNSISSYVTGQIIQDGELLNQTRNYQEAFGFQLLDGKPFYFFKRDGQIGTVYDGQETLLGYVDVPHYGCCSAAALNPRQYSDGVIFFAQRGGTSFYVAIGLSPESRPTALAPTATPTIVPASSTLPINAGGFILQVSEVQITDRITIMPTSLPNLGTVYRGELSFAEPGGLVIKDAAGDAILLVATRLLAGDRQNFLNSSPEIIEDEVEKSPSAIMIENEGNGVLWIYDVNQSSKSFIFVLPGGVKLDLKPMIHPAPYNP